MSINSVNFSVTKYTFIITFASFRIYDGDYAVVDDKWHHSTYIKLIYMNFIYIEIFFSH